MATRQSSESAELKQLRKRVAELEETVRASEEMLERNADSFFQISPTENRTAEDTKLLDGKTLLGSLLYHLDDGVIVVDPEGEMILFNEAAHRLIGKGPVAEGDNWKARYDCFRPDRVTPFPSRDLPLSRALRGETVRDELVFVTSEEIPEGNLVKVAAMTLRDDDSHITGAIVIFHDVTHSHKQQAELDRRKKALARANLEIKTQQNLLESILESVDIGITVVNASGEITVFNTAARRLLGAGPVSGVTKWSPQDGCYRMNGSPYPADELPLARALRGETVHGEKLYVHNPELKKNVLLSIFAAPFDNSTTEAEGALCLFYDITGEQEMKALFENVLENIEIAVTLVDSSGEMLLFNAAARRMLGVGPIDGQDHWSEGYGIYQFNGSPYPPDDLPLVRALKGEYIHDELLRIYNPEIDKQLILSVTAAPFVNPAGNFKGALCFGHDITDTTEAQKQVISSEERFRAFMTNLPAVAFIKDADGRYLYGNDAFYRYHRTTPEKIAAGEVTDFNLTSRESAMLIRANDQQVINGVVPLNVSEILANRSGTSTWFDVYKFRLTGPQEESLLAGIAVDITDRREHARRLEANEKLLRNMIELQEKERLLVAHDIHDGFVQEVVGAKMLSEALRAKARSADNNKTSQQLEQISRALSRAINDARRLVSELRPLVIDEEGIVEAIRYLIAEKRYAESIKITFIPHGLHERLDPLLEGNLFRIVQEALNNVIRHSDAGAVSINLTESTSTIKLTIKDDGAGFNSEDVPLDRFGIRGMRERARIFGGTLKVRSESGVGTTIDAEFPHDKKLTQSQLAD